MDENSEKVDKDEALAPFLKFFAPRDSGDGDGVEEKEGEVGVFEEESELDGENEGAENVNVEYYEPKPGDFVVEVVVSVDENKLDVNVGADLLGGAALYDKEMDYLLCDTNYDAEEFMVRGKMGIVKNEAVMGGPVPEGPVVETGTVLFVEVLGRTLRRISWHRVRQIKQLNERTEVRITEMNTGGLLTRIEVGCRMHVQFTRIDEAKNDLVLSEKEAWELLNLEEGTLLEGTVKKIFPNGAQVRIGETNRWYAGFKTYLKIRPAHSFPEFASFEEMLHVCCCAFERSERHKLELTDDDRVGKKALVFSGGKGSHDGERSHSRAAVCFSLTSTVEKNNMLCSKSYFNS
ncbi:hypothetical protein DVH24_037691 [Malus domestica]|uniref:S1 motif domain-containing protein n=1 Tax=Malus domestica TaxID=3750 RepID=A0A498IY71_MALDO|nr:hypothetical protein DVH24_037691 [Malus domestica]